MHQPTMIADAAAAANPTSSTKRWLTRKGASMETNDGGESGGGARGGPQERRNGEDARCSSFDVDV